jgi:FkbM family methyltransferase
MWRTNLIKLTYRLNAFFNATRVGNFWFMRSLNQKGKQLVIRRVAPDNTCLVKVDGSLMYIHTNTADFPLYAFGPYEPYTAELFKRVIKPGATVLDIGAQYGYFSLIAAHHVGLDGKIYAFEPSPTNFQLLKQNIYMNKYTNIIHPLQKAVGDKRSTMTLFVYENSDAHSMYRHPQAAVKEEISVECITIDEFLGEKPVDVIKMDIDGHDPYGLQGMKKTIAKSGSIILFAEFAPAYLRRAGVESEDYLAQLKSLGFDTQVIDERSHCLKPVTKALLARAEDNPSWYVNLYCVKRKH